MAWYNTGNIALTNGSATVTGSGTNFLVGAQIGEALYAPDGKLYEIQTIDSATVITLASNYLGSTASAQGYQIIPTQSLVADLASDVTDLISDFADVRDYAGNGKFNDGAVGTPGITFTQDQDNGLYRIGSNNWALAAGGQKIVDISTSGIDVTGSVTADGLVVDGNDSYTSNIKFDYGASAPTYFANWGYKSSSDGNKVFLTITDGGAAKDVLVANYNGNVGIGRTPDTVYSGSLQLALGNGSQLATSTAGNPSLTITDNSYLNASGNHVYKTTNPSTRLEQYNGTLTFSNAASGTAGATISYTERLRIAADGSISTPTAGANNVRFGANAGNSIASGGNYNVLVGDEAGTAISTGDHNTVIGFNALVSEDTGSRNTAIGRAALELLNYDGDGYNTAVGFAAGTSLQTGIQNCFIGSNAGDGVTTGTGNICIGHGADTAANNSAYSITLGRNVTSIGDYYFTFGVDSSVHRVYNQFTSNASWTRVSDERVKKDVLTNTDCGLDFINDLRTVTYKFKAPSELDPSLTGYDASETEPLYKEKMYGFVAQEVKAAMDAHNITDFAGHNQIEDGADNMQGISYEMFVMPLVKAVQELSAQNAALTARIAALEE
jgi:hypothetical protein